MNKRFLAVAAAMIFAFIIMLAAAINANEKADATIKETDNFIKGVTNGNSGLCSDLDSGISDTAIYTDERQIETAWTFINEKSQVNSTFMGVQTVTDETSPQWAWLQSHDWKYNADGVCCYDDRILVALSPAFGSIGDYVDLALQDGSILKCIIVDYKWNADTYGHRAEDGSLNVLELIVNPDWYNGHENIHYPAVIAFRNLDNIV